MSFPDNNRAENFIEQPDVIDVVLPYTEQIKAFLAENSDVVQGKVMKNTVAVYTKEQNLSKLAEQLSISPVNLMPYMMTLMGRVDLESAGISQVLSQPYLDLRGNGTVVGIVDTGIDYTNAAFVNEDGMSKIDYIWDQSISGSPPPDYGYGTVYSGNSINEALSGGSPLSVVPSKDESGHGTFIASVAAGREVGDNIGAAPDAGIIAVKLRKAKQYYRDVYCIPEDSQDAYSSIDFMQGIEFILEKALELKKPVSVCVSLGTNSGGHSGMNLFESYIVECAYDIAAVINCAAGSEGIAKHHFRGKAPEDGGNIDIEFRVAEQGSSVYLELWNEQPEKMEISITSPTGEIIGPLPFKPNVKVESKLVLENSYLSLEFVFPVQGLGSQLSVLRITDATPGVWKIVLTIVDVISGIVDAYLPITGLVAEGTEFLVPEPGFTLVSPSTALGVISVNAYNAADGSLYAADSLGPTTLPLVAPIICAPGVNVSGSYPAYNGTMTGTGVAAAITAGASALLLQWGYVDGNQPIMNSFTVRSYYIRGAARSQGIEYPDERWGYGKLDLYNVFRQMANTE